MYIIKLTEEIGVVTSDGRLIVGTLVGHDQVQNLILKDAIERVYNADADVEEVDLGLYVIRGDNVCLIGELDDAKFDKEKRAPFPLPSIQQQRT